MDAVIVDSDECGDDGNVSNLDQDLYSGSCITTEESLLLLSSLVNRHNLFKRALSDLLKVISVHLPEQPKALQSLYMFQKFRKDYQMGGWSGSEKGNGRGRPSERGRGK